MAMMGFGYAGFNENNYRVEPRVVRCDCVSEISIYPIGKSMKFDDDTEYKVGFIPTEVSNKTNVICDVKNAEYDSITAKSTDGVLSFEYRFAHEQKWVIAVVDIKDENNIMKFPVFSLYEDLYNRNPYLGDLHIHTSSSPDASEDILFLLSDYRKAGFDFMAITDHMRYYPSVDAIEYFKDVKLNFTILKGEEVHLKPSDYMHIISVGCESGITDYFNNNIEEWMKEVEEQSKELSLKETINKFEYSLRCKVADKIREGGGMAIMAHPHWVFCDEYNTRPEIVWELMKNGAYDAIEVVAGVGPKENNLQTAMYNEMRAEGIKTPIVGSSDTHYSTPSDLFCVGKTLAFANGNDYESIRESVKNYYTVAIEQYGNEEPKIYGSYRLVKYAQFLLEFYFPHHNELCAEESVIIKKFYDDFDGAKKEIEALYDRTKIYSDKFMGKNDK